YVPYINSRFVLPVIFIIVGYIIYSFNPNFLGDMLTATPAERETMLQAFSHKIPCILFLVVSAALLIVSQIKKMSLIPILGLLSCLYLMPQLEITNWLRFFVWRAFGLMLYRLYGIKNSRLRETGEGPSGFGVINVLSVSASIALISFAILPLIELIVGMQVHPVLNFIIGLIGGLLVEGMASYFERQPAEE